MNTMKQQAREVQERDFRKPEFIDADPSDYEFRESDGAIVRKDRWERGIREIAGHLGWSRKEWEIDTLVEAVRILVKTVNESGAKK